MQILLDRSGQLLPIGELWDELQLVTLRGQRVLRRVYRTRNDLFGPHLDTAYWSFPDFGPIRQQTEARLLAGDVIYRSDSILGWRRIQDSARVSIARARGGVILDAAAFDLVIRAADLAVGLRIELPAYLSSEDRIIDLTATVAADSILPLPAGGSARTWVVDFDFGGLSSTVWVEKDSRRLVRQVIRLAPTAHIVMVRSCWVCLTRQCRLTGRLPALAHAPLVA